MKKHTRAAFTLVELIVVLAILAILLILIVPKVTGYIDTARQTAAQNNASAIVNAAELYIVDKVRQGNDPSGSLENGGPLDTYLSKLDNKDHYQLSIRYDDSIDDYVISGQYQSGTFVVSLPSLEIQRKNTTDNQ